MIRHIFVATAREGTSDEVINRKMDEMCAMKGSVPAVQVITAARNPGWAGPTNVVTMAVDVKDKVGSGALLASPAHCEVADKAVEVFCTDNFMMAQIELQSVFQKCLRPAGGTALHAKAGKRTIGKDKSKEGRFE